MTFPETEPGAHIVLGIIMAHRQAVSRRLVGFAVGRRREDRRGDRIWQGQMVDCSGHRVEPAAPAAI